MSEEAEIGIQTLGSSSETIELRFRQETEMDTTVDQTPTDEFTLKSVDERSKQATDPILRRMKELCALSASPTDMDSASNSEASGSRCNQECISPSRNWYDTVSSK